MSGLACLRLPVRGFTFIARSKATTKGLFRELAYFDSNIFPSLLADDSQFEAMNPWSSKFKRGHPYKYIHKVLTILCIRNWAPSNFIKFIFLPISQQCGIQTRCIHLLFAYDIFQSFPPPASEHFVFHQSRHILGPYESTLLISWYPLIVHLAPPLSRPSI